MIIGGSAVLGWHTRTNLIGSRASSKYISMFTIFYELYVLQLITVYTWIICLSFNMIMSLQKTWMKLLNSLFESFGWMQFLWRDGNLWFHVLKMNKSLRSLEMTWEGVNDIIFIFGWTISNNSLMRECNDGWSALWTHIMKNDITELTRTVPGNEMQLFISTGSLWNLEQALPSSSKEYRPGDQSRDDGGGGAGENTQ